MGDHNYFTVSRVVWTLIFTLFCPTWVTTEQCPAPLNSCMCDKESVSCDNKMLSVLPVPQSDPTGLKTYVNFKFDNNQISTITNGTFYWAKQFYIQKNGLTSIDDNAFAEFSKLEVLDLSFNLLKVLRKEMFVGLLSLKRLYIQANQIKEVKMTYFSANLLPVLAELHLGFNPVDRVEDDALTGFSKLTKLRLAHCNLSSVPGKALSKVPALQYLELEGNTYLEEIEDGTFKATPNLIRLQLSSCGLNTVKEHTFDGLTKLKELLLYENKLSSIDPKGLKVFEPSGLTILHLQSNKLKTLSKDALTWKNVGDLKLQSNPWSCDCHLKWMAAVESNATCASPDNLKGKLVTNVTEEEFSAVCPPVNSGSGKKAIVLAVVITLVVIGVLLIGFFVWKIYKKRREQDKSKKGVRYSAVYKDTVETNQNKPGEGLPTKPTSVL